MTDMEKYGVLENVDVPEKTAEEKTHMRCPKCNTKLVPSDRVNVLKCPQCGTLPFER